MYSTRTPEVHRPTALQSSPAASPSLRAGGGNSGAVLRPMDGVTATPASSFSTNPAGQATADVPRNEEDVTHYVLYDGLPTAGLAMRHARERQTQAYLKFTHRIRERVEAAHAIVLSANPLSLSVMASQLRMYRWRVTEAQTLLEATSLLQDFVADTVKHGFRVRRRPAAARGVSRYAHGRGKLALKRIAQEEREKLAGAGGGGLRTSSTTSPLQGRPRADASQVAAAAESFTERSRRPTAAAPPANEAADEQAGNDEEDEEDGGVLSSEHDADRLPLPPSDALPRLVLVDGYTHEDFADIARHVRFVDKESGLELLLVLLLPTDPGAAAVATQGAGCVVTPEHETTIADAYEAGYDLVLAHSMDNLLVDFLTSAFVSSVGRWRNDVRSKAAVGNYMSVRNVLLGGLDISSLQRLVWDDNTDDAEVLELLGAQSLSTQGGARRFGEAGRQLLGQQQQSQQQQQQQQQRNGRDDLRSGAASGDDDEDDDNGDGRRGTANKKLRRVASSMMSNVPRLRSRPSSVAHFGVRLPVDPQSAQAPLSSFGRSKDVLGGVMTPAAHRSRHRRRYADDEHNDYDGTDNDEGGGNFYDDGAETDQRMLHDALEREMGRLMAENDGKQAALDALQKEVESLHRTVRILKRHAPGGGSGVGGDLDSLTSRSAERPDSGSMVHLAKQQQIYILKERLEAANDHIVALLKDGASSEKTLGTTVAGRGRGGGNERGRGGRGISGAATALPAAAARRAAAGATSSSSSANVYRRRAYEAYHAAREAEMLALLDEDAHYVNATLAQIPQVAVDGSGRTGSAAAQRKEREATDQVIHSLQKELRALEGRLDAHDVQGSGGFGGSQGDLQARMAIHLQAAVERLEAERQRVRHLEGLRQTDQLLLTHAVRLNEHAKRELSAARRAEETDSNASAGEEDRGGDGTAATATGKRGRRAMKPSGRAQNSKKPTEGDGGEKERTAAQKKGATGSNNRNNNNNTLISTGMSGGAAAAGRVAKTKVKRDTTASDMLDTAQVEGLIAAAVTDAVAARNRVFQRQLAALMQTCKTQLTRVVLKHQKPRTIAYVQMLKEELEQAKRDQRGAFMRLQFTLSHLRPDQYDAASIPPREDAGRTKSHSSSRSRGEEDTGEEENAMVPLRAVTDADVRRAAERVAREHAAYAMRAAYMAAEMQRVQRAHEVGTNPSVTTPMSTQKTKGPEGAGASTVRPPSAGAASASIPSPLSVTKTASPRPPSSSPTPSSPGQLLHAYQSAAQQVKEAIDAVSPVQTYLAAVQAEMEAEQRLRPWCDVDCARLFQALPTPSANFAVPPAPNLALMPTYLHRDFPSASEFTLQSDDESAPLYLPDLDGSVRDVADVYGTLLRSFVSLGEGWALPHRHDDIMRAPQVKSGKRPKHNTNAALIPKKPLESGEEDGDDVDDDENKDGIPSFSTAATAGVSIHHALAQLPLEQGEVSQYQGRLDQLYTAATPYSPAHRRLYETLLQAYQQQCIAPLHMAAIEATVLTRNSASSASYASTLLQAAHAQHGEVLGILQLIAPTATPALRSLTQQVQQAQRLVEQEAEKPVPVGQRISAGFLASVDAALLGCVVDELRWRRWRRATFTSAEDAALPEQAESTQNAMLVEALVAARATGTASGAPPFPLLLPSSEFDVPDHGRDRRMVGHYTAFCAARARASRCDSAAEVSLLSRPDAAANPDDLFAFSDVPPALGNGSGTSGIDAYGYLASLLPRTSSSASGGDGAGRSVAHELAELLGRRHTPTGKTGSNPAAAEAAKAAEAALLRDIYTDEGADNDEGGDANMQAIRRLRMELEYMEMQRAQRMQELALRCDWRLHGRHGDGPAFADDSDADDGGSGGNGRAGSAARAGYPAIDPERLNFTVKSGTSAWYGMEAAKRVRAILRRRARPDQVIVGGGPDGGGVGIELSRRTAQPAAVAPPSVDPVRATSAAAVAAAAQVAAGGSGPTGAGGVVEDENGYQVEDIRDARPHRYDRRAAPSHLPSIASSSVHQQQQQPHRGRFASPTDTLSLPPLRLAGVSRAQPPQQHQHQRHGFGAQTHPTFMAEMEKDGPSLPISYVSPRDAVSVGAYANLASTYDGGFTLDRDVGGGGDESGFAAAQDLSSRVMAYRAELTRAAGRLSPTSTSTYANGAPYSLPLASLPGVGDNGGLLSSGRPTVGVRPRQPLPQHTSWIYGVPASTAASLVQQQSSIDPQQPRDTVLFMPPRPRSSVAEVAERGRQQQQQQRVLAPRFLANTSAAALPYMTPAAMAAQRLQTMLNASMEDPSVVGVPSTVDLRALFDQQQRQRDPASTPTTPRASPELPSSPSKRSATAAREPPSHERQEGAAGRSSQASHASGSTHAWEDAWAQERLVSAVSETGHPIELDTTIGPGTRNVPYEADDS